MNEQQISPTPEEDDDIDVDDVTRGAVYVIDLIAKPLVWYSVIMLAVECHLYPGVDSHRSPLFFLWSERVVAAIFTIELLARTWRYGKRGFYPFSAWGMIDVVSILPFWIGFLPGVRGSLHLVRTLRVLRMLKFFRYSRGLQVMSLGFYRAYFNLRPLLLTALIIILFTMFALFEVEGPEQPENFRNLFIVAWFLEVTGTTVGYGDMSPATIPGKAIVMVYMVAGLAIFMACFSAITNAFDDVFDEAKDPDFKPLEQFHKVRKEQERIDEASRWTGTVEEEDAEAEEELERRDESVAGSAAD